MGREKAARLLYNIFGTDFAGAAFRDNAFKVWQQFLKRPVTVRDLGAVHEFMLEQEVEVAGRRLPAMYRMAGLGGERREALKPVVSVASLHGNEPSGLGGILWAMAMQNSEHLKGDVYGVLGSPHASRQYWEAMWEKSQKSQSAYDQYRGGVVEGVLLPDPNRVRTDFREIDLEGQYPHVVRANELDHLVGAVEPGLIIDGHSARGDLQCLTACSDVRLLRGAGLSHLLPGLDEAIAMHASASLEQRTLKPLLVKDRPGIDVLGTETGAHHDEEGPMRAALFMAAALQNAGVTSEVLPHDGSSVQIFHRHQVEPKLTFGDLLLSPVEGRDCTRDQFYTAKPYQEEDVIAPDGEIVIKGDGDSLMVVSKQEYDEKHTGRSIEYVVYQFSELEQVERGQLVAVGVPSGAELLSPRKMSVLFVSKSAREYSDPAVGPYPVAYDKLREVKFAYPCDSRDIQVDYDNEHQVSVWNAFERMGGLPKGVDTQHEEDGWLIVQSPLTEKRIGAVHMTTPEQVNDVVEQASIAWKEFSALTYEDRKEFLEALAVALEQYEQHLAQIIHSESGKPMSEALGEAKNIVATIRKTITDDAEIERLNPGVIAERESIGVVGLITPFNFPGGIASWTFAPALLAGNGVVWKPSEETPLTAAAVKQVFDQVAKAYNVNPYVLSVVQGGAEVGQELVKHEKVDKVSATGGHKLGAFVEKTLSSKVNNLHPPILELGGESFVVFTPNNTDEQLQVGVDAMMRSFLGTAGQRCTNTRRLYVHEGVYGRVMELVKGRVEQFVAEGRFDPVINAAALERFSSAVSEAGLAGAEIFYPGHGSETGLLVTPCIAEFGFDCKVPKGEVFGPLLKVQRYSGNSILPVLDMLPPSCPLVGALYVNTGERDGSHDSHAFIRNARAAHLLVNPPNGTGTPAYGGGFGGTGGVECGSGRGEVLSVNPLGAFTKGSERDLVLPDVVGKGGDYLRSLVQHGNVQCRAIEFHPLAFDKVA